MMRFYGWVVFSIFGALGIILEATPTIRVYPETVGAGSVARLVISDFKNPISGQIEGLGRPAPLIALPDNVLTGQLMIPSRSKGTIALVLSLRNRDNQRQSYPFQIRVGDRQSLGPLLDERNQELGKLESKAQQLMQRLPTARPSQRMEWQTKLDQTKIKISELLKKWMIENPDVASGGNQVESVMGNEDNEAAFKRDEDAFNERVARLELWVAERGENDPSVIQESKALNELDASLSLREARLKSRQMGVDAPPNGTERPHSDDQGSRDSVDIESAEPFNLAKLEADSQFMIDTGSALLKRMNEKEAQVIDLESKISTLKSGFKIEKELIDQWHHDSIQRQAEYVKKQDELSQLAKTLDAKKNQLSKLKGVKVSEFQSKLSELSQLTQTIQNKKNVLSTLMSIMRTNDTELSIKKNEYAQKLLELKPLDETLSSSIRELDVMQDTLATHIQSMNEFIDELTHYKRMRKDSPTVQNKLSSIVSDLYQAKKDLLPLLPENHQEVSMKIDASLFSVPHVLLGAFSGFRKFESQSVWSSGPLVGIRGGYNWGNGWGLRVDGWAVSSMINHRNKWVAEGSVLLTNRLWEVLDGEVYGIAGITMGQAPNHSLSPEIGLGIKWNWIENIMGNIEISGYQNWGIQLGVSRLVSWFEQDVEEFTNKQLPAPKISMQVSNKKRVFTFPIISLTHLKHHWGQMDIERMMRLGIISYENNPDINPNRPLTRLEAARMIAFAQNIPDLLKKDPVIIDLEIESKSKTNPLIQVEAYDQKGQLLSTIMGDAPLKTGKHALHWKTPIIRPSTSPVSFITLRVRGKNKLGDVASTIEERVPVIEYPNFDAVFKKEGSDDTYRTQSDLLSNWEDITGVDTSNREKDGQSVVTRLSFVIGVSHVIELVRGKSTNPTVDLSAYRDANEFPSELVGRIAMYISELEYGGDSNKKFRPYSYITVAEASRIINRLLNWQETRTGVGIPK